jgi:hypothetical protein
MMIFFLTFFKIMLCVVYTIQMERRVSTMRDGRGQKSKYLYQVPGAIKEVEIAVWLETVLIHD